MKPGIQVKRNRYLITTSSGEIDLGALLIANLPDESELAALSKRGTSYSAKLTEEEVSRLKQDISHLSIEVDEPLNLY